MVIGVGGVLAHPGWSRKTRRGVVSAMLKTGQKIKANILWQRYRSPGAVSHIERRPHIVKLVFGITLEYQSISVRPLDQTVSDPGDRIRRHRKGQRWIAGGNKIVPIVLARISVRVGEFDIGKQAIGPRFMNPAGVEHRTMCFVLVESQIQKLPLVHSSRR